MDFHPLAHLEFCKYVFLFQLDSGGVGGKLVKVILKVHMVVKMSDGKSVHSFGSFSLQRFSWVVRSRCRNWLFSIGYHVEYNQASYNGRKFMLFLKAYSSPKQTHFLHASDGEGCVAWTGVFFTG